MKGGALQDSGVTCLSPGHLPALAFQGSEVLSWEQKTAKLNNYGPKHIQRLSG